MEYRVIDKAATPEQVQQWLEVHKYQENHTILHSEDKTYFVVTRGEKKTGGYGIEVLHVTEKEKIIIVQLVYINPKEEQMVIQMISYPYLIIEVEKTDKTFKLEIVNHG